MKRWTPATDETLKQLRAAGFSLTSIATALGFGTSWISAQIARLGPQERAPNGSRKPRRKPAAAPDQGIARLAFGTDFSCPRCHRNRSLAGSRKVAGQRVCGECASGGPRVAYVAQPAKVTVLPGYPGYDVRFQCAPGETVFGRFSMAGPGRDVDGRPWERTAA